MNNADCRVCRLIRTYLMLAVPLLALIGITSNSHEGGGTPWFARVQLIDLLSWGCLAALISVVLYRGYQEYYLPAKREKQLSELQEKLAVDELDSEVRDSSAERS